MLVGVMLVGRLGVIWIDAPRRGAGAMAKSSTPALAVQAIDRSVKHRSAPMEKCP